MEEERKIVTYILHAKDYETAVKHLQYASMGIFKNIIYFLYNEEEKKLLIKGEEL